MGAPHNPARYGEVWPRHKIMITERELDRLRNMIVLSGGWAWHFMSVEDHAEYKHAHDHKDVDLFVHPNEASMLIRTLQAMDYVRVPTRYDTGKKDFQRYETVGAPKSEAPFKIVLDVFIRDVPFRVVRDGWRVVEPEFLLSLYDSVHMSSECFAVTAAKYLIEQGLDPVNDPRLSTIPLYPKGENSAP